jgi:hypothetical protein
LKNTPDAIYGGEPFMLRAVALTGLESAGTVAKIIS